MRKLTVVLGILLVLGASGLFVQRWLIEPAKHGRYERSARGFSEPRSDAWRSRDRGDSRRPSGRRNAGPGGLQILEMVIDVLNVVVGIVGIWLAVLGLRLHRSGSAPTRS
jgi:hypothetical protein